VLPLINSRRLDLLDDPRLLAEGAALERRTARCGRDSIDHAGGHDDLANAACGALVLASTKVSWLDRWGPPDGATAHATIQRYG
jgi:hypothetical protein